MAKISRAELKAHFQTNKIPSQSDFEDLIDSAIIQADDNVKTSQGDPLNIKGEGTTQELLAFYKIFDDRQPVPAWKVNQNPANTPGLNIATGDGASRLFIDEKTGAVNIGGTNPITTPDTTLLQVGDDTVASSNGQLMLTRIITGGGNRSYRLGVNDQYHFSIGDFGYKENRKYVERLTIEHPGRVSVKSGLEVNGLLEVKNDIKVTGLLDVNGDMNIYNGFKMKGGIMKWGDGAVAGTIDPGIYSTGPGIYMKFGTNNAPIRFYVNKLNDPITSGEPTMTIATGNRVGIGTTNPYTIEGASVLQLGDDRTDGTNGQIVFGKKSGGPARSFKMGMNNSFDFSIGDYGNAEDKTYSEALTIGWSNSLVNVKKSLTINENLTVNGTATITGKTALKGNVGIGTENPFAIPGSSVLQVGDDSIDGARGEIILGAKYSGTGYTRSFKMGMTEDGSFSLGDYGNYAKKEYKEYLHVQWDNGNVGLKGSLYVGGHLIPDQYAASQGIYIVWNRQVGSGSTHLVNHRGTNPAGGFKFEKTGSDGAITSLALLDGNGAFNVKTLNQGAGANIDSDLRIKNNIQSSNGAKDLAMLNRLRVTDYDFLGNGKQNDNQKGVIAQEIEQIIPQAVHQGKAFVASIFAAPAKITATGKEVLFTMNEPHQLIDGDLLKLIIPQGDVELTVRVVDEKSFRVEGTPDQFKDVLIYGKEVNDFRRVNYQHLFLLNLSATQELSKKIDALLAWKASFEKSMVLAD